MTPREKKLPFTHHTMYAAGQEWNLNKGCRQDVSRDPSEWNYEHLDVVKPRRRNHEHRHEEAVITDSAHLVGL